MCPWVLWVARSCQPRRERASWFGLSVWPIPVSPAMFLSRGSGPHMERTLGEGCRLAGHPGGSPGSAVSGVSVAVLQPGTRLRRQSDLCRVRAEPTPDAGPWGTDVARKSSLPGGGARSAGHPPAPQVALSPAPLRAGPKQPGAWWWGWRGRDVTGSPAVPRCRSPSFPRVQGLPPEASASGCGTCGAPRVSRGLVRLVPGTDGNGPPHLAPGPGHGALTPRQRLRLARPCGGAAVPQTGAAAQGGGGPCPRPRGWSADPDAGRLATLLCLQWDSNLGTALGTWQACHLLEIDLLPKRLQVAQGSGAEAEEGPCKVNGLSYPVCDGRHLGPRRSGRPGRSSSLLPSPRCSCAWSKMRPPPGSRTQASGAPTVGPGLGSKTRAQPWDVSVPGDPAAPSPSPRRSVAVCPHGASRRHAHFCSSCKPRLRPPPLTFPERGPRAPSTQDTRLAMPGCLSARDQAARWAGFVAGGGRVSLSVPGSGA